MRQVGLLSIVLGSLPLLVAGCDSASPVAPTGTTLTISATPSQISSLGTADIRVVARKGNGTPVNPGTVVIFTTTLGEIDPSAPTDESGVAVAALEGKGRKGTAMVSASSGTSEAVTVDVQIGFFATSITLQTTPSTVPESGGEVALLALVRDDQSQPLPGATVNFRADVGILDSGGSVLLTDDAGEVRDRLVVTAAELDAIAGDSFEVSVDVGGSGGALISSSNTIAVLRIPRADFTFTTNNLTAIFTDTSTGNPTSWLWNFGDTNTSTQQNPTHNYSSPGTFTVTLRATNSAGSSTASKVITVTGQ